MLYKFISFVVVSLTISGMILIVAINVDKYLTIAGVIIAITGLVYLDVAHSKVLKKINSLDKEYFDHRE
ncbi:MAG TPA: hypothetical protein VE912_09775 [Bacteroidales bacterium]|nr:hypothetical protein [Bacteroidales bacterium]